MDRLVPLAAAWLIVGVCLLEPNRAALARLCQEDTRSDIVGVLLWPAGIYRVLVSEDICHG